MIRLWRTSWPQFVPFLDYDHEVRKVLYTTNIIESLNARFRQAARRRGHFPTERTPLASPAQRQLAASIGSNTPSLGASKADPPLPLLGHSSMAVATSGLTLMHSDIAHDT